MPCPSSRHSGTRQDTASPRLIPAAAGTSKCHQCATRVHGAGGFGPTALFRARVCLLLTQPPAGKAACSVPRSFTPKSLEDARCAMGAATPAREASDKQGALCLHGTQARFHTRRGSTPHPKHRTRTDCISKGRHMCLAKDHRPLLVSPPNPPDTDLS